MKELIKLKCPTDNPEEYLDRTYKSMIIEWWLHNVGYYVTKPFIKKENIYKLNLRFKDVDIEEIKE